MVIGALFRSITPKMLRVVTLPRSTGNPILVNRRLREWAATIPENDHRRGLDEIIKVVGELTSASGSDSTCARSIFLSQIISFAIHFTARAKHRNASLCMRSAA
jgi:hypothetical protein